MTHIMSTAVINYCPHCHLLHALQILLIHDYHSVTSRWQQHWIENVPTYLSASLPWRHKVSDIISGRTEDALRINFRVDAAAYSSPLLVFCFAFLYVLLCVLLCGNTTVCWVKPTYSHQDLLSLGFLRNDDFDHVKLSPLPQHKQCTS